MKLYLSDKKIRSIMILFMAICLAVIAALVYPSAKSVERVSEEIMEVKNKIASYGGQKEEIGIFLKNHTDYESEIKSVGEIFIDKDNPVKFIEFLEKTASISGVEIDVGLTSSDEKSETSNPSVIFQVSVKGSFDGLLKFAERIEKGPFLAEIKKITVGRQSESAGKSVPSGEIETFLTVEVLIK